MNRLHQNKFTVTITCLILALSGLSQTGCNILKPQADPTRYFLLDNPMAPDQAPGAISLAIGVRRITLPDYLQNTRIAVRRDTNELIYSEYNRWSERLDTGISRTLAAALKQSEIVNTVDVAPWIRHQEHDYLIDLAIIRFEGNSQGQVTLVANWEIANGRGVTIQRGQFEKTLANWNGTDYAALASSMAQCISDLASHLTEQLAQASTPALRKP